MYCDQIENRNITDPFQKSMREERGGEGKRGGEGGEGREKEETGKGGGGEREKREMSRQQIFTPLRSQHSPCNRWRSSRAGWQTIAPG